MKIEMVNGIYMATFKHRSGGICFGYSPRFSEAMTFCAELIADRDALTDPQRAVCDHQRHPVDVAG
jgi:hypothetical protein